MLNVINSTYETWRELNFADLQKHLEDTVVQLASNRESGDTARKALVKLTIEYRKTASEEVKKSVQTILKRYQSEIDAWRQRSTFAEDAFISIYKRMMDLPAELNAISKRAERSTELECDARKLRETVDALKNEINQLKQYEHENKRLKKAADDTEGSIQSKLQAEVSRLQQASKQMVEKHEDALFILRTETDGKVAALEQKCLGLSQALQLSQSDVFNLKTKVDQLESGRSSELELLTEELEKANDQLLSLQSKAATSSPMSINQEDSTELLNQLMTTNTRVEEMEQILTQRTNEIHSLNATIHALQTQLSDHENDSNHTIKRLTNERASLQKQLSDANEKLAAQADYAEVYRELKMLRSVEFPEHEQLQEEGDGEGGWQLSAGAVESAKQQPLEVLLVKRNKTLVNQLTELNVINESLKADVDSLKANERDYRNQVAEKEALIQRLESDLYCVERLVQHGDNQWRASASLDSHRHDEGRVLSEAMDGQQTDVYQDDSVGQVDTSLFRIVQHQRDRLKLRSEELEQSCANFRQQASCLQREVQQVRDDNVKLYEKIRFLQSYSYSPASKPRTSRTSFDGVATRNMSPAETGSQESTSVRMPVESDATVVKYSQAYADHLDPFNQFSQKERQRTYQSLPPHEKFLLSLGRVIVGDRRARLVAFIYAIGIHLLIFLAIYQMAYFQNTAIEAENTCAARYAEHMRAVHSANPPGNPPH